VDFGAVPPLMRDGLLGRISQIKWAFHTARHSPRNVNLLAGQPHLAIGIVLAGRPFSVAIHGGEWQDYPLGGWMVEKVLAASKLILTSSSATAAFWVPKKYHPKVVSVVPGLPKFALQLLSESAKDEKLCESTETFRILAVARSSPRKGIQRLITAIQICRELGVNVNLTVAGQSQGNIFVDLSVGGVEFAGNIDDRTLSRLYFDAHVFALLPEQLSGGEGWEGFGIVYLEAAAAGLPILASNTGGVTEALSPHGSFLLEKGCSPEDIAAVLIDLADSNEVYQQMVRANKTWAESQQWKNRSEKIQVLLTMLKTSNA